MHGNLCSIPIVYSSSNLGVGTIESEVQGHPWLHSKFESSLAYRRSTTKHEEREPFVVGESLETLQETGTKDTMLVRNMAKG